MPIDSMEFNCSQGITIHNKIHGIYSGVYIYIYNIKWHIHYDIINYLNPVVKGQNSITHVHNDSNSLRHKMYYILVA